MSAPTDYSHGDSFITDLGWQSLADRLKLSDREVQIARALLADETELAIALRLGISPHTVHTHIERLYRKLHVSSRIALAVKVFQSLLVITAEPHSPLPPICSRRAAGGCPFAD